MKKDEDFLKKKLEELKKLAQNLGMDVEDEDEGEYEEIKMTKEWKKMWNEIEKLQYELNAKERIFWGTIEESLDYYGRMKTDSEKGIIKKYK